MKPGFNHEVESIISSEMSQVCISKTRLVNEHGKVLKSCVLKGREQVQSRHGVLRHTTKGDFNARTLNAREEKSTDDAGVAACRAVDATTSCTVLALQCLAMFCNGLQWSQVYLFHRMKSPR